MGHDGPVERFDTVVVGGGQAGLAMGYHLARQGREFVILDAGERVGDAWRGRWDSLRLFSPAAFNALPGMPFPAPNRYFPTKDDTADYLEEYARAFDLPVRLGRRVDSLRGDGEGYLISTGEERCLAHNVVVATGSNHTPRVPEFARRLDPSIVQLHSSRYRNPGRLPEGDALVVGVGNSGAEISVELSASRHTYLSGWEAGNIPVSLPRDYISRAAYAGIVVGLWIINRALNVDTRAGRKLKEYDRRGGSPLARLSPPDIARAGVERVPRVEGVVDGRPELADGRVLEVASVVWATGFKADFGWIELPVFEEDGSPIHYRGVVEGESGLYFLGLPFQYTITSAFIDGVGRDARYIADDMSDLRPRRGYRPGSARGRTRFVAQRRRRRNVSWVRERLQHDYLAPKAPPVQVSAECWGSVPRTYVESLHDQTIPIAAQRKMQRQSPGALTIIPLTMLV